jgi:hypothetical protein
MSSRPLLFGSVLACVFILLWSGAQPACSTMAKVCLIYLICLCIFVHAKLTIGIPLYFRVMHYMKTYAHIFHDSL